MRAIGSGGVVAAALLALAGCAGEGSASSGGAMTSTSRASAGSAMATSGSTGRGAGSVTGSAMGSGTSAGTSSGTGAGASSGTSAGLDGGPTPANPNATADTVKLYRWIANLPNQARQKVVSGEFIVDPGEYNYPGDTNAIEQQTGQNIGYLGVDYFGGNSSAIDTARENQAVLAWWGLGGIVGVDIHMPNPFTGGGSNDVTASDAQVASLTTAGTPENLSYLGELDEIAAGLAPLQSAGVVVFFRPMMEMGGNWFWWGNVSPASFISLWQFTFSYLTYTKGLNTLLWVFGATAAGDVEHYPGAAYVDIVGDDIYQAVDATTGIPGYGALATLNKPIAVTEVGGTSATSPIADVFDEAQLMAAIKAGAPNVVYVQHYNWLWGMFNQQNATGYMNDPWSANLGALDWQK